MFRHMPILSPRCRRWRVSSAEVAHAGRDHRHPAASAAATTSSSRTEPPGWMIALTPASIASCGPSAKGKNASEASDRAGEQLRAGTRVAFSTAMRTASTRLICPAPMPIVAPPAAITIALERTWRQTLHANSRSLPLLLGRLALRPSRASARASRRRRRGVCTSWPPITGLASTSRRGARPVARARAGARSSSPAAPPARRRRSRARAAPR